ncbi:hypothetical protein HHI36_018599 [Cryptolaemus montrouzieri]|uniref:Uncharacterized protein n=1 Tax=Cryptolaemus montrouzieri TaxID=559131 RepID=A0ABD2P0G3_9CUCU
MELKNYPVVVVAVYGPIDVAPASEKDKFHVYMVNSMFDLCNSRGDIDGFKREIGCYVRVKLDLMFIVTYRSPNGNFAELICIMQATLDRVMDHPE